MERTLVLLEVCGAQTIADNHVVALKHFGHHVRRGIGRVGVISIRHHIHVSINILEHGSHHITFALPWFFTHHGTLSSSDFSGTIGGVVVVHIYGCFW